jgi:hypothetical protein
MRAKNGRLPFSTGSWLKPVLKVFYEPVLMLCGFSVTWAYEPVLMHPLVWVCSTTGAKAPGMLQTKALFSTSVSRTGSVFCFA